MNNEPKYWLNKAQNAWNNIDFQMTTSALEQYAELSKKTIAKNSEERSIILDLGRVKAMAWLGRYILDKKLVDRIYIIGNKKALGQTAKEISAYNINFIDSSEWFDVENLQGRLFEINEIEEKCGFKNIWHWIANDRWLYYCTKKGIFYNEKGHYSHDELKLIVRVCYSNIYSFINTVSPRFIISHDLVSLQRTLLHEIGELLDSQSIYLLPTRIGKYLAFSTSPFEQFEEARRWADMRGNSNSNIINKAEEYIHDHLSMNREFHDSAQLSKNALINNNDNNLFFENLKKTAKRFLVNSIRENKRINLRKRSIKQDLRRTIEYGKYRFKKDSSDNFAQDGIEKKEDTLNVLYALHSEPETALSLYAPHLPSQDATSDIIARSLPFNAKLYVKDHPRMARLRHKNFYQKLKNRNPNVKLLSSSADALSFLEDVDLVFTVSGTIGIEALMFNKPVITLGACHYQHLYGVTPLRDLSILPETVKKVLSIAWDKNKMRDELTKYIAGCMAEGYPIGWWSDISDNKDYDYQSEEFERFCKFMIEDLEGKKKEANIIEGLTLEN